MTHMRTRKIVCNSIRLYQIVLGGRGGLLSVLVGGGCLHSPSCSEYTYQSVLKYGVLRGLRMGIIRIASCNRFTLSPNQESHGSHRGAS